MFRPDSDPTIIWNPESASGSKTGSPTLSIISKDDIRPDENSEYTPVLGPGDPLAVQKSPLKFRGNMDILILDITCDACMSTASHSGPPLAFFWDPLLLYAFGPPLSTPRRGREGGDTCSLIIFPLSWSMITHSADLHIFLKYLIKIKQFNKMHPKGIRRVD